LRVLYFLVPLYIICCLFLIAVVLLQQGKGADLAGAFGAGGGTQAAFGARSATTLLHKLTTWAFVAFIVLSLGISLLESTRERSSVVGSALKKQAAKGAPARSATGGLPNARPIPMTGGGAPEAVPPPPAPAPARPATAGR
jgi:preprotein translocase subunit SecG